MSDIQPNAVCQCGYPLLPGQDCPECGRAYGLARVPGREPVAYWVFSLVGLVLFIAPFVLIYVVGQKERNVIQPVEQGMWVLVPALPTWLLGCVANLVGLVLGLLAWRRTRRRWLVALTLLSNAAFPLWWAYVIWHTS